jgi:hypothetical protein
MRLRVRRRREGSPRNHETPVPPRSPRATARRMAAGDATQQPHQCGRRIGLFRRARSRRRAAGGQREASLSEPRVSPTILGSSLSPRHSRCTAPLVPAHLPPVGSGWPADVRSRSSRHGDRWLCEEFTIPGTSQALRDGLRQLGDSVRLCRQRHRREQAVGHGGSRPLAEDRRGRHRPRHRRVRIVALPAGCGPQTQHGNTSEEICEPPHSGHLVPHPRRPIASTKTLRARQPPRHRRPGATASRPPPPQATAVICPNASACRCSLSIQLGRQ